MGELADKLGGKVDGELIRAVDWNALIDGIESQFDSLGGRLDAAEAQAQATEDALDTAVDRIAALEATQQIIESRYRNLELTSTRSSFAIGERAEIVARVTAFDGTTLDLSQAATRPWVDFVTVWGSLKAAPGFTSRTGTGGKTVSVQVNANGEARALLRENTGVVFPEEDELEISAVLATTIGGQSVADSILAASTPASSELNGAFTAVANAYERNDTTVMRNYLDGIYLANPTRNYPPLIPAFTLNWHDEFATVLAFVKPDDSPGSGDSAMAAGSIRVTFRDWVYPWIVQYIPPPQTLVDDYVAVFIPELVEEVDLSANGIFTAIGNRTTNIGLLSQHREWAAASQAMAAIPVASRPSHFESLEANVIGGLSVQQGLAFSAAAGFAGTPPTAAGAAVAQAGARGEAVATSLNAAAGEETANTFNRFEGRILDQVRAENTRFSNELLADGGPVHQAEIIASEAAGRVEEINNALSQKAGLELVSQLLAVRDTG